VQRQLRKRPHRQRLLTSVAADPMLLASSTSAQVSDETINSSQISRHEGPCISFRQPSGLRDVSAIAGCRSVEEHAQQRGDDEEYRDIADNADVAHSRVAERHPAQPGEREYARRQHQPPDPSSQPTSLEYGRCE
jgi:hypothetical protein